MRLGPKQEIVPILPKLARPSHVNWWELQLRRAHLPGTSFDELHLLAESPHREVRFAVLLHPNLCPWNEFGQLDLSILVNLAHEFPEETATECPTFLFLGLVEKCKEMRRIASIIATRADAGALFIMLEHFAHFPEVRSSLACNLSTPDRILKILANPQVSTESRVRYQIAQHPKVSSDTLAQMANMEIETSHEVLRRVAEHEKTPHDALLKMIQSHRGDSFILHAISSRKDCPRDMQNLIRKIQKKARK